MVDILQQWKKTDLKNFSVHFLVIITVLRVCTKKKINKYSNLQIAVCHNILSLITIRLLFVMKLLHSKQILFLNHLFCSNIIIFQGDLSFMKKRTIRLCFWQKCDFYFFLHRSYLGVLTLNVKVLDFWTSCCTYTNYCLFS